MSLRRARRRSQLLRWLFVGAHGAAIVLLAAAVQTRVNGGSNGIHVSIGRSGVETIDVTANALWATIGLSLALWSVLHVCSREQPLPLLPKTSDSEGHDGDSHRRSASPQQSRLLQAFYEGHGVF